MKNYFITELYDININDFKKLISNNIEFEISFPLASIGFSQSSIDIVQDYTQISYCSEKIAPFITIIDSGIVTRDKYYKDFKIKCFTENPENLAIELRFLSEIITQELSECDDLDVISFYDGLLEYEESYNKRIFAFPELINGYWANIVNQAYWEIASEYGGSDRVFFSKVYRKYPEQRFRFWKNPLSTSFQERVYFSTENWIIPPDTSVTKTLNIYSGFAENSLIEEADVIDFKGNKVLITNYTAIYFDHRDQLQNSINCTELVLNKQDVRPKDVKKTNTQTQFNIWGEKVVSNKLKRNKSINYNIQYPIDERQLKYYVSEYGNIIIVEYKGFSYIFFSNNLLSFEELKELNSFLYPAFSKTQKLINMSISEECNWNELNDDIFEEMCYDILYCHPNFDSSTIQKMGKSKSRDGGRDITIKTKKSPTRNQELYIFQCKFYSDKTSLSASKIPNAGNVIMQYGAKGYGVFTTTVIDSTLYDMLAGFNENLDIDTSICFSKYELERYLNHQQFIKEKYFKQ